MNKSSPGATTHEPQKTPAVLSGTLLSDGAHPSATELSEQIKAACSRYDRVVTIDCSTVDGGGIVLRTAVALSAVVGIPVHLTSLHSSQEKPGIGQSHVSTMSLFSALLPSPTILGNYVGSTELFFATKPFTPSLIRSVSPCFLGSQPTIRDISRPAPSTPSPSTAAIAAGNSFTLRSRTDSLIRPGAFPGGSLVAQEKDTIVDMTVGAAGSVALLAGLLIPTVSFSGCNNALYAVLRGGTDVPRAPPTNAMEDILMPILFKIGVNAAMMTKTHGFQPKGRGEARLRIIPMKPGVRLRPLKLVERGELESILIRANVSCINKEVGIREATEAMQTLKRGVKKMPRVDVEQVDAKQRSFGEGTWLEIRASTSTGIVLGAECVGQIGKRAETVGREAATQMVEDINSGTCVDHHVQDQILAFLALADGQSRIRVGKLTPNTQSVIRVLRAFFGDSIVTIEPITDDTSKCDSEACIIVVNGIGFSCPKC